MGSKLLDLFIDILLKLFGEKVIIKINERVARTMWSTAFEKAIKKVDLFNEGEGDALASSRSMLRYYYATFNISDTTISVENFAIALAMELHSYNRMIDARYVYDLSEAILTNWHESLINSDYFKEKYTDRIDNIQYWKSIDDYDDILKVLGSNYEINKHYFNSYNCNNSSTKIRVWLPRPDESWLRWEKEHSIDIGVNPMKGFETGFFQIGFDYSEVTNENIKYLEEAYFSLNAMREGAMLSSMRIGEMTGNIIWMR